MKIRCQGILPGDFPESVPAVWNCVNPTRPLPNSLDLPPTRRRHSVRCRPWRGAWDSDHCHPPPLCPDLIGVCLLPLPRHAAQILTPFHKNVQNMQQPKPHLALKHEMDDALVSPLLGQLNLPAAAPHPNCIRVEQRSWFDSLAACDLERAQVPNCEPDHFPKEDRSRVNPIRPN